MPIPIPPTAPPVEAHNRIFIIEPIFVGQSKVFIYGPTVAMGKVMVIPVSEIARAQGNIIIESITQTYFRDNIKTFIPYEFWKMDARTFEDGGGEGALEAYTEVFAITLDEIKQAIDQFPLLFDIDHCPPQYLRVIAELLNYPLEDVDTTAKQRKQLKSAIQWYQSKGSQRAFVAILYAFGYYAKVVPLWTEDYAVFTDTIPGVAKGNDPPNDFPLLIENGGTWYRSPHFGIRLISIVNDQHVFVEWGNATQQQINDFNAIADVSNAHTAWYQMVDELSAAGALLRYHFSAEDFRYIWRRLEFLRPVFAVLEWLEFLFEMQEHVDDAVEPVCIMTANPTRSEKGWYLGYCDQDDIQYTRLDERLLGPDMLTLVSPLVGGAPGSTTVTDEVAATVSGSPSHINGTLDNAWLWPGVTFTVTIDATPVDVVDAQAQEAFHYVTTEVFGEQIIDGDGVETDYEVNLAHRYLIFGSPTQLTLTYLALEEIVPLTIDEDGVITGTSSAGAITGVIYEETGELWLSFPDGPVGPVTIDYVYQAFEPGEIIVQADETDGTTKVFSGKLAQLPLTEGSFTWLTVDYGDGIKEVFLTDAAGVFTGDEVSGTINYTTGVWGITFVTAPALGSEVVLQYSYPEYEGVLKAEGVLGVLDYSTGAWWLDFEAGYEPDDTTSVLADYIYTSEVPPTDRSGAWPRGSTELPFPHVRDPREGICHPPEELDIDWYWIPEEQYTLALTRDGMNLYPPSGPVPYIDHSDFPSRGFDYNTPLEPGHANTFTRQYGYSTRPLSLLRVEANPVPEEENWENQFVEWESWTGPWENIED